MRRVFMVLAAMMAVTHPGVTEVSGQLRQLSESTEAPLTIEGAKVATEDQAKKLAIDAYFRKMRGKRALQTAKVVSINELDVEISGFARKGDKVWEVRILGLRGLNAVIWVHSQTAKTFFLIPRD